MKLSQFLYLLCALVLLIQPTDASIHQASSAYMSYEGLVMTGYQAWFRAPGDGSGRGWVHWGKQGQFDEHHCSIDFWPDVSEYAVTYETPFRMADGSPARVFSSLDQSTIDVHFRWMREYQIDGAFLQRFYGVAKDRNYAKDGNVIFEHALEAARREGRAVAVVYDLSGLQPGEDCSPIIEDWKELVDQMRITNQGSQQTYLYHGGKPVVGIWGVGFPDRPYDIQTIGLESLIDFLQNDPVYGGCSVMLGVPTNFRELIIDTTPDTSLHGIIESADILFPWYVQRFTPLLHNEYLRYYEQVKKDAQWCETRGVEFAALTYPGFSWYNLSSEEQKLVNPPGAIPRQLGSFYWGQLSMAIEAGAKMLYIAMFDEVDEGTAIFKCTNEPPVSDIAKFQTLEGLPNDFYLDLTRAAKEKLVERLQNAPHTPDQ